MDMAFLVPTITINESFETIFSRKTYTKSQRGGLILSDRIEAQNFRLRESDVGYESDWHVAGDPTFICILQGTLRIILRDTSFLDFKAGDQFIAEDYLPSEVKFNDQIHGHRAAVIGDESLKAIHIKLDSQK